MGRLVGWWVSFNPIVRWAFCCSLGLFIGAVIFAIRTTD